MGQPVFLQTMKHLKKGTLVFLTEIGVDSLLPFKTTIRASILAYITGFLKILKKRNFIADSYILAPKLKQLRNGFFPTGSKLQLS